MSKFTSENIIQDPLISKITNIKQLNIANKLLNIQASITPITKLMASYLLLAVIFAAMNSANQLNKWYLLKNM